MSLGAILVWTFIACFGVLAFIFVDALAEYRDEPLDHSGDGGSDAHLIEVINVSHNGAD